MRYLSLFSGIEAATAAWHTLGWECVGVAEIEGMPCALLAEKYPRVPNLGDITKITEDQIRALGHIDLLVFGSPCQDLSVAGKRKGFTDEDGNVTRSGLFHAAMRIIGWVRKHCALRFALWENVPGAFSSNAGRDFAVVVGELAGLEHVDVPKNGWGNEGCAVGECGMVEWSTLDAQWFGVAQRRRRVFAFADFGDWSGRQPVLLEPHRMRGNTAPRREAGQSVAGTISARTQGGGGLGTDFDLAGGLQPVGVPGPGLDLRNGAITGHVAHTVQAGRHAPDPGGTPHALVAFNWNVQPDQMKFDAHTTAALTCSQESAVLAFSCKDFGADAGPVSPTLRSMNSADSHQNGGGGGGQVAVCVTGAVTHTLKADGFDASEDGTGRGQPIVTAYGISPDCFDRDGEGANGTAGERSGLGVDKELAYSLRAKRPGGVATGMQVRRLTPMECERLQGFADGYTNVIYNRKPAKDGPRYKALGNSMAVPVMNWIGRQIDMIGLFQ